MAASGQVLWIVFAASGQVLWIIVAASGQVLWKGLWVVWIVRLLAVAGKASQSWLKVVRDNGLPFPCSLGKSRI